MNKGQVVEFIRDRFGNVSDVGNGLFRAERTFHGTPIGVFYFDLSESIADPDFSVPAFLDKRIAPDFYKHEGSLQWNYYMYFVLDRPHFNLVWNSGIAARVEADRRFARKFVKDTTALREEFEQSLVTVIEKARPAHDLASDWVEALSGASLDAVADPKVPYTRVVRDYLSGGVKNAAPSPAQKNIAAEHGRFLSILNIERFRPRPREREFRFGTVNLIRGVNGSGKTSLLEAIELAICGCHRRQDGHRPRNVRIDVKYLGESESHACPLDEVETYRARDNAWYGGYYRKGNQLCYNFGRYNFFDSDAAFRLSSANDTNEIKTAIEALFLGERAAALERRMQECRERFDAETRTLERLVQYTLKDRKQAKDSLAEIREITDTRPVLASELRTKAKDYGWKAFRKPDLPSLARLEEAVSHVGVQMGEICRRVHWLPRISLKEIAKEKEGISAVLERNRSETEKKRSELNRIEPKLEAARTELSVLERLNAYHTEPGAFGLLGSQRVQAETRQRIRDLEEATQLLAGLNLQGFGAAGESIKQFATSQQNSLAKQVRELSQLEARLSRLQTQSQSISALIAEIKGLGRRFSEIAASPDCPLCGAKYGNTDDLSARIVALPDASSTSTAIRELTAEISRKRAAIDQIRSEANQTASVMRALELTLSDKEIAKLEVRPFCSTDQPLRPS